MRRPDRGGQGRHPRVAVGEPRSDRRSAGPARAATSPWSSSSGRATTTLIAEVREAGARIKLIGDGDLSAAISCAVSGTGVHAVMGIGGAPEGVITAAALRCLGGEIQARFRYRNDEERERGARMGHGDEDRVYATEDLAPGENLVFAATGVTAGDLLQGVRFFGGGARTHSLVMAYQTKQVRFVDTVHMFDRESPPRVRSRAGPRRPGPPIRPGWRQHPTRRPVVERRLDVPERGRAGGRINADLEPALAAIPRATGEGRDRPGGRSAVRRASDRTSRPKASMPAWLRPTLWR